MQDKAGQVSKELRALMYKCEAAQKADCVQVNSRIDLFQQFSEAMKEADLQIRTLKHEKEQTGLRLEAQAERIAILEHELASLNEILDIIGPRNPARSPEPSPDNPPWSPPGSLGH